MPQVLCSKGLGDSVIENLFFKIPFILRNFNKTGEEIMKINSYPKRINLRFARLFQELGEFWNAIYSAFTFSLRTNQ
jgi:hypothetical protein